MIINNTNETVTGTIATLQTEGFKIANTAHMMEILSKRLYNNPELAVCRELVCNAIDAHVLAGNTKQPVEVFMPSWTNDFRFVVKDYGTGLSEEDVLNLYTTYGASTKQSSNNFIGCLGIGSKSPFAVTDEFSVLSRYKGIATTYHCYKQKGLPVCTKLSEAPTDEHDGMTITVPFRKEVCNSFNDKCASFFKGVNKDLVKVEGPRPYDFYENIERLAKYSDGDYTLSIVDFQDYSWYQPYVRMGQVIYRADSDWVDRRLFGNSKSIVLDVPIGTFVIAANRENLEENKENKEKFQKIVADLRELYLNNEVRSKLRNCKTARTFLNISVDCEIFNVYDEMNEARKKFPINTQRYIDVDMAWERVRGRPNLRIEKSNVPREKYTVCIVPDEEPVTLVGSLVREWSKNNKETTYYFLEGKSHEGILTRFSFNTVFMSQLNRWYRYLQEQAKRRRKTSKKNIKTEDFVMYEFGISFLCRYKKSFESLKNEGEVPYVVLKELKPVDDEDCKRIEDMYRHDWGNCYGVSLVNSKGLPDNFIPLKDYIKNHQKDFEDKKYKQQRHDAYHFIKTACGRKHQDYWRVSKSEKDFLGKDDWLLYMDWSEFIDYSPRTYGDKLLQLIMKKMKKYRKFLTTIQEWFNIQNYNNAPVEVQQLLKKLYEETEASDESASN